jgi:hypothetical protein
MHGSVCEAKKRRLEGIAEPHDEGVACDGDHDGAHVVARRQVVRLSTEARRKKAMKRGARR